MADRTAGRASTSFRDSSEDCWRTYLEIADAVLEKLAEAAGVEAATFVERCDSRELNTLRLLNYAPDEAPADKRRVGIAAHTDFECITLLYQDAAGLELCDADGHWQDAPMRDGRLVVMLGDMLERWTNGTFRATGHRVRNTAHPRRSIVMFIAANDELVIEPLAEFVSAETPAKFEAVTQAAHIDAEVQRAKDNARAAEAG